MPVSTAPPVRGGHHLRRIVAGRGFRHLLTVRLVSQVSDGFFQAGLAGSLLFNPSKNSSAIAIATGFAILLLPYSFLGPYVGVLLDRWDRRISLTIANLIRAAAVVPAVLLIWSGDQGARFALCALVVIGVNRFFLSGLSAGLPRVVDDSELVTANALSTTAGTISFSIGLFTAASFFATSAVQTTSHGYAVIAAVAALGYLTSALLTRGLFGPGDLGPAAHERPVDSLRSAITAVARGMSDGVRHLISRPPAARAMLMTTAHRVLYGYLTLAVLLLYSRYFGQSTPEDAAGSLWALGQVVIAGAAGAGVAAVITPAASRRFGNRNWISGLLAGIGVTIIIFGLPFRAGLLLVAAALMNVASQSIKILVDATLQHECDDEYRGRIFSLNDTAFNLSMVVGLFIAALTVPSNGKSALALIVIGVGYFLIASWFFRSSRPLPAAMAS